MEELMKDGTAARSMCGDGKGSASGDAQAARSRTARVRVLEEESGQPDRPQRRAFLQTMAAQGLSIPAASFLLANGIGQAGAAELDKRDGAGAIAPRPASATGQIIRDFADPYIELIRLLHEASEIEHALMVQYLYAAFSLKPAYGGIAGYGIPTSNDCLGVAIQEMQHLGKVTRLLAELGASPSLVREDFPYEPEIYPFEFQLEPMGRGSLAKYVYAESPPHALDSRKAVDPEEKRFLAALDRALGGNAKRNHLGSLYANIIGVLQEYIATPEYKANRLKPWVATLEEIKREGEEDHFRFFKQVFMGTHKGFGGHPDVWSLPPRDAAYPSYDLPLNPTAYVGHRNQIQNPVALGLAWLGNLHYWTILLMVDCNHRTNENALMDLAKVQMMVPFWAIARHLPTLGSGMPFDPLTTGYSPCRTAGNNLKFLACMVRETDKVAHKLEAYLPKDYPLSLGKETFGTLSKMHTRYASRKQAAVC